MRYCTHCGKEITEESKFCACCGNAVEGSSSENTENAANDETCVEDVLQENAVTIESENCKDLKCKHCGAKITEETQICTNCGCKTAFSSQKNETKTEKPTSQSKKSTVKIICIAAAAVCAVVLLYFLAFIPIKNHIKTNQIKEKLSDETFRYYDSTVYYALGKFTYTEKELRFDSEANCEYYYYYSSINAGSTYDSVYEIKFKDGNDYIVRGSYEYKIKYDDDGEIESLYDTKNKEEHEKQ